MAQELVPPIEPKELDRIAAGVAEHEAGDHFFAGAFEIGMALEMGAALLRPLIPVRELRRLHAEHDALLVQGLVMPVCFIDDADIGMWCQLEKFHPALVESLPEAK